MSTLITQDGFNFTFDTTACNTCEGKCCTGESGNIFVSLSEIKAIVSLLDIDENSFREQHLVKKGYKYSLQEKIVGNSHDCIFYSRESNGCTIYQARPQQCQTFPFWDYFKNNIEELKEECPGISND